MPDRKALAPRKGQERKTETVIACGALLWNYEQVTRSRSLFPKTSSQCGHALRISEYDGSYRIIEVVAGSRLSTTIDFERLAGDVSPIDRQLHITPDAIDPIDQFCAGVGSDIAVIGVNLVKVVIAAVASDDERSRPVWGDVLFNALIIV